jgi:hypothetical protein
MALADLKSQDTDIRREHTHIVINTVSRRRDRRTEQGIQAKAYKETRMPFLVGLYFGTNFHGCCQNPQQPYMEGNKTRPSRICTLKVNKRHFSSPILLLPLLLHDRKSEGTMLHAMACHQAVLVSLRIRISIFLYLYTPRSLIITVPVPRR